MKYVRDIIKWITERFECIFIRALGAILQLYFRITKDKDL